MIINNNFFNDTEIKNFASFLSTLSPIEFASIGCIIGILLSSVLTSSEQNSIGNLLELIGQVILTAQAQSSTISPSPTFKDLSAIKQELYNYINKIKK